MGYEPDNTAGLPSVGVLSRPSGPAGRQREGGRVDLCESEDDVAKKEYLLSTGQLDNPAEVNMATYKAEAAIALLVQLRERAMNAYSELSRISL